jgi:hypothetical protein
VGADAGPRQHQAIGKSRVTATQCGYVNARTYCGNKRPEYGPVGDNLRATNKMANNTAEILKRSTLPAPAALIPQQTTPNEATTTI